MREFTPTAIKNLFAALIFIERPELELALNRAVKDVDWFSFPASFREIFVKASDSQREALTKLINSKLAKEPEHV